MADRQLTEEDLKNMSPEQIAEVQKQNCLFCHIISGKIPAKKVYEDEKCLAFLDINPAVKGHMLLVPKEHFMVLPQAPEELLRHLAKVSKRLSLACLRALGAQGTNIFVANGAIAGQRAPHAIIHIIPRTEGDTISCFNLPEKAIPEPELMKIEIALKKRFGIVSETPAQIEIPRVEERREEPKPISAPIRYITSSKAKRFHVAKCPFADKISEENRIYLTPEEAMEARSPCECTGLRKTKSVKTKNLEEIDLKELKRMLS